MTDHPEKNIIFLFPSTIEMFHKRTWYGKKFDLILATFFSLNLSDNGEFNSFFLFDVFLLENSLLGKNRG
jgi:hypothetical protein